VGDEQIDIRAGEAGALQDGLRGIAHGGHRLFENLAAFHPDITGALVDRFVRGRVLGAHPVKIKEPAETAVALEIAAEDAAPAVRGLKNRCTGAVAEEDRSSAVLIVGDAGERLPADDQHRARLAGGNHGFSP